ncbi:hypothetical protein ABR36_10925 [Enterobacter ludwigii]|nr:hypothetical protein ABR36_10925 [Enterobacter ludwigii]
MLYQYLVQISDIFKICDISKFLFFRLVALNFARLHCVMQGNKYHYNNGVLYRNATGIRLFAIMAFCLAFCLFWGQKMTAQKLSGTAQIRELRKMPLFCPCFLPQRNLYSPCSI